MLDNLRKQKRQLVAAGLSLAPLAAFAQGNPWDSFFTGVTTAFGTLLTSAYTLAGVIVVGMIIFGLAKRMARKAAS